ncbi:hypothetical protein [Halorubellus litoreus]|uniref:Uncharacterized protein n=1 Tax=Halorubellus litoreus TaxID=755308 RepID=A0ABD5VIS0_9EURY
MTDQGLTEADHDRIRHFLSKPRYDRSYRDLLPAHEREDDVAEPSESGEHDVAEPSESGEHDDEDD